MITKEELKNISDQRYLQVVKANTIIQKARFSLSTQQQKILLYIISKIQPDDEDFKYYEFNIIDFANVCGIGGGGKIYTEIKKAIKDIHDKSMWIKIDRKEILVSFITEAEIEEHSGTIRIRLNQQMKPYLLHLAAAGNYTQYQLINVLKFRSKFSIRLYELICSLQYDNRKTYEKIYTLDEVRELLDADKYPKWDNLKNRVLNPAMSEINEYTNKIIYFVPITKLHSKKVEAVKFVISSKSQIDTLQIQVDMEKEMNKSILLNETLFDDKIDLLE